MGKNRDSGRSKTRPSSSSLAASLLPTGITNVGFGGYVGSSRIEETMSREEGPPPPVVNGEIAQHLNRLGRKDPTTKLKALTALSAIFMEKGEDEIVQIIPQWAFEYKKLLVDYNREVRRATHETMSNLVVTVRRGLAPHLKSLMGPWWFSQFDETPEISQAARRSLEVAFPAQEKRLDALILYSNDIFLYLDENLKLTPQGMSDKVAPADELEDMHTRVISLSLLAIATLIEILLGIKSKPQQSEVPVTESKGATKARKAAISSAEQMFAAHKYFLEFLKSKNSRVRSSTYTILGSFIKYIPQAFDGEKMKALCAAVLASLQEKDSSCHSAMWDMILLFCRTFPDCWAYGSIQKNALNGLSQLLRNGFYGSSKVSYPVLVFFLDLLPSKVLFGENYIMSFFSSFWVGRNHTYSSSENRHAFFKAFKECFLWGLFNASRYLVEEELHLFQVNFIDNVLVKLLWHYYLPIENINEKGANNQSSKEHFNGSTEPVRLETYPRSFVDDVGKCILEILSVIFMKDQSLLNPYCMSFQKDCWEIFQRRNQKCSEHINQIANFFSLLDGSSIGNDQAWALQYLAGPLIASNFPSIKSIDSPEAVSVLIVVSQIFGPRSFLLNLFPSSKGTQVTEDCSDEPSTKHFLHCFKDYLVPWCLSGCTSSLGYKLDLLIGLIDNEVFYDQWNSIVVYATSSNENENFLDDNFLRNADRALILAMLLDKLRNTIRRNEELGFGVHQWKHELLESTAVSVAYHPSFTSISHARFLSVAIGDSSETEHICFLSKEAINQIFEAIFKNLVDVLLMASYDWIREVCSLMFDRCLSTVPRNLSSVTGYAEMAQFSFEVLESSFFCLNNLDRENKLIAFILFAVLVIDWESRMSSPNIVDEHVGSLDSTADDGLLEMKNVEWNSQDLISARLSLGNRASAFRAKMSSDQWRSISPQNLMILRNGVVQIARSAIFDMNILFNENIHAFCCCWIMDVFYLICENRADEQIMLDQLFAGHKDDWPLWVAPDFSHGNRLATPISGSFCLDVKRHHRFVAFIEKIVFSLGVDRVLLGFDVKSTMVPLSSYSRPWLAAEVLCTWKWNGGSTLNSFLPMFVGYDYNLTGHHEGNFVSSVVNILLDGAILHGSMHRSGFLNVWTISEDEIECLEDPFLRALIAVLFTVIAKDEVWCKDVVVGLLRCVVDKLFIGTSINRSCLRVLPFILNVICNRLLEKGYPEIENLLQSNVLEWLQITLSLPPTTLESHKNEDLEGWIQVIVSLYPLNAPGFGLYKVSRVGSVTNAEKMSILDIFHKQRLEDASIAKFGKYAANPCHSESCLSLSTQMLLARLMAVSIGYCWEELDDDDWNFVFSCLHFWIRLSVPMMEEITEEIQETVNSNDTRENVIKRIELAIHSVEPSHIDLSLTALIVLSLILEHSDEKQVACNEDFCSSLDKWNWQKDKILEDVLRLFFSTGAAEAIAKSLDEDSSLLVATNRFVYSRFWQLVASCATCSATHVRNSAVQSMQLWGLGVGAVSSLFALLFSCKPMYSLQFAAYHFLSTDPLCTISLFKESNPTTNINSCQYSNMLSDNGVSLEEPISMRDDLSIMIKSPCSQLLEMDLLAHDRISFFLAWALLLTHLQSLPSPSLAREKLTQHIRDSISSVILDCLFQCIPLKPNIAQSSRKKDSELPIQVSKAANAATRAITTCSLAFAVESLWPAELQTMATVAGSIYGLMIRLLPAYVSNWFSSLRDRSLSCAIESFTKGWCSPPLITEEFSQIKAVLIADDEFSVSVSKSAFEIIATYKKEETGMDLVMRLPSCYPLRPVDVDCTRSLGISEVKQRKWLLSLTAFIRNQNGAIAEAIRMWKSNFDKEFQGIEECPICYSIIHTTNHSLPRLPCKTCKHKFHSACLYKWFSTSHKSLCPLCQMPF